MLIIGLTGGIGSGKSEVSRILMELGAEIIDADKVGHQAYVPHSETWEIVLAAFGNGILDSVGEIDRKKLGAIIFKDPDARRKLNAIMHPQMHKMISTRIHELQEQGTRIVVLDAALLVEAGWLSLVNEVWVTTAPEDQVIERLQSRNGIGEEEVRRRINAQMASKEREKYADIVIENSGSREELRQKAQSLWEIRVEKGWGN